VSTARKKLPESMFPQLSSAGKNARQENAFCGRCGFRLYLKYVVGIDLALRLRRLKLFAGNIDIVRHYHKRVVRHTLHVTVNRVCDPAKEVYKPASRFFVRKLKVQNDGTVVKKVVCNLLSGLDVVALGLYHLQLKRGGIYAHAAARSLRTPALRILLLPEYGTRVFVTVSIGIVGVKIIIVIEVFINMIRVYDTLDLIH